MDTNVQAKMTKVCCFCETWGSGGIEAFLVNVLEHMDRSNIRVEIVASHVKSDLFQPRLQAMDIPLTELSGNTRHIRKNYRLLRDLFLLRGYDVVHFNIFEDLSLLYVLNARRAGIPIRIAHAHGAGLRRSSTRWLKLRIHALCRILLSDAATGHWACSDVAARFMFSRKTTWELIPNGIDLETFRFDENKRERTREELAIADRYLIGCIGRLESDKNHTFPLDVLKHVRRVRTDAMLMIVGEGREKARLQKKARSIGLEDHVLFYGISDDIPSLLCAMDIFVLPSVSEGLGIVVIEAQANGLTCLCSTGVPQATRATELVSFLPLRAGAAKWAEHILSMPQVERASRICELAQAGYVVEATAQKMRTGWLVTADV